MKSPKPSRLEHKRGLLLQVGLILSLSLTIAAFKLTSMPMQEKELVSVDFEGDEPIELLPPTIKKPKPKQKAPKPKPVKPIIPGKPVITPEPEPLPIDPFVADTFVDIDSLMPMPDPVYIPEPALVVAEEMPSFKGGYPKMMEFIQSNVRYPEIEHQNGIQGTVYVQFVVEKDGSISKAKAVKGPTPGLKQEALRVVKMMPSWNPGKQNGKNVRVKMTLPVKYKTR